ncbi:hypothetical protein F5884DRAFT_665693 [Xylogone sp. PMI_703]|nr:hypothetical protein F5884DRAFT_665693 [Xylogone sp. PMI_703]
MALSVQHQGRSMSNMWDMGDPPTSFSSMVSETIPISSTYQYPVPPGSLDPSTTMIPSFHQLPLDPTPVHTPSDSKPSPPSINKNGGAMDSNAGKIKRSMSTPNVRSQSTMDAATALAMSAEKRRNKLGYHRTSVACGHCRRRKIRCIPAPGDPQNRCSNCIRLKKECNFYPVDQQPPSETKRRDSTKTTSGASVASASSSPTALSEQLSEGGNLQYSNASMPPIQELDGPKRRRTDSFSSEVRGSSRGLEYPPISSAGWVPSEPSAVRGTNPHGDMPLSSWRINAQDSPVTPTFSPYGQGQMSLQSWQQPVADARDEMSWSLPQRSASYGNLEALHSGHQYSAYPQPTTHHIAEPYPPKHGGHHPALYPQGVSTSPTTLSELSSNPADGLPQAYNHWQQPYPSMEPNGPAYGSWNGNPRHPQMVEAGQVPMQYGYPEPPNGSYYPPPPNPRT